MAHSKFVDMSPRSLSVDVEAKLVPGTIAQAVHHLLDALDLSAFDAHYFNDDKGASAHAAAMLLKAVLLAYSQAVTPGSRHTTDASDPESSSVISLACVDVPETP